MKIIRAKDYEDMSRKAANVIASQIILKNDSVLGLATGSTVIGLYKQLIRLYESGDLDFSEINTVNLDEYVGLSALHPQSYRYFMDNNLFKHVNIPPANTRLPDGMAKDTGKECSNYDAQIEELGGIDLQLLGLGLNGHIGFNEPDAIFPKGTHCVDLTESTIKANSRFFNNEDEVPKKAITMGIKNIMEAKMVVLCVSGKAKAPILPKVLFGPVTPNVPGSILQLHNNLTVVADLDALSETDI